MPQLVSLTCSSLQISDKTQTRGFPISSFPVTLIINRSCRKSTTSDDTDMKLGPVTKIEKRNTATSKELTVTSCRQIMTPASLVLIHGWFGTLGNLDYGGIDYNSYIFINSSLLYYKNQKRNLKISNTALILLF